VPEVGKRPEGREKCNTILEPKIKPSKPSNKMEKDKTEVNFLENLNANNFSFLPSFLISKLDTILNQYRQIVGVSSQQQSTIKDLQNDKLIREIKSCNTELELCRKIEGFMGTFLQLAKNYKDHRSSVEQL
jgi:hypothetical protein